MINNDNFVACIVEYKVQLLVLRLQRYIINFNIVILNIYRACVMTRLAVLKDTKNLALVHTLKMHTISFVLTLQ